MFYRYGPYPFHRRYYNLNPYYYHRYYPFRNYSQNIMDSQIANIDQNMINYGDMTDVSQNSNIYQLRTPDPDDVGICTAPTP